MSERFRFASCWHVDAEPERVFDTLVDFAALPRWWREFRQADVVDQGGADAVGRRARVVVRGIVPVALRFTVTIASARRAEHIRVTSEGHLAGAGGWSLTPARGGTDAHFVWDVRLEHPVLRHLTWLLRPVLTAGHDWIMRRGERRLRARLAND